MDMSIIWLAVMILMGIIEALTVDLVSIWFCVGALVALIESYLGISTTLQIISFIGVALILFIFTRPVCKRFLRGNIVHTNSDRVIGQKALVTQTIFPDKPGEIKVLGKYWTAISRNDTIIETNKHVEVLAIDGVKLIVQEI